MIKLATFFLAILFFCKPALPLVSYLANYDYVSKELCINKDNDKNACQGKCQLKKELAKASGNNENAPSQKLKSGETELLFIEASPSLALVVFAFGNRMAADNYCDLYLFLKPSTVFHPPSIA